MLSTLVPVLDGFSVLCHALKRSLVSTLCVSNDAGHQVLMQKTVMGNEIGRAKEALTAIASFNTRTELFLTKSELLVMEQKSLES